MKIFNKIQIWKIVKGHFLTLKNNNSKKISFDDIFTFFMFPLCIAGLLIYFNIGLNEKATNIIITTLSILVGLLFNVIVIIFDIIKRDNSQNTKNTLVRQLLSNISYSIIVSIFIIVFTLVTYVDLKIIKIISVFLVYFLIGNYFLTVLMILKRMYALFENEIKEIEES